MARFRSLHPVNTQKHEITWSNLSQDASTVQKIAIANGKEAGAVTTATASDVIIGAHVKSIYFEFHFSPQATGVAKVVHWSVTKEPFNTNVSAPNLYNQQDKRFTFKRGMEMLPVNVSTVFKRIFVVKIPPRFSRMGDNDLLSFNYVCSSSEAINACGFAIYKEIK